ncbi:hypothetical protein DMB95_06810 [Campylobacter sp. MIT 12-8780]|uniref:helix-turn-helix domain-containing protein n=1 Tax=unclassified Campylobacter TaxID=2593542 RepID=UPI00051378CB|nr:MULTISPECIES: helix-turn-helix domain-containing protein [unclassified Campylobacter]KGI56032.1 hypothetical protein LR59_09100 [Campylobacter sp. MIT 97-5078]KGI57462.1 hypothetical protein LR59_01790 [Campylobacter sp. MIT 97-5078]KGI57509.1 hypothetical protein LR59_02105 [Campylobacter sp. MIT 97-5078]NDJ27672.1 hypothetical protein [Campylobacter sp. MIT 19-121]TQR27386.1 hypothetical protein DMB91_03765 [Campylobacter sp. MIT 97-5078]
MSERIYCRRDEAAKILQVSCATIINWVKQGYIKEYRIHKSTKSPLYNIKEIEETLKNPKA